MTDISRFGDPTENESQKKPKDISRFGSPSEESISSGEAALRGAKTAVMEPIYGVGEYIPGEIGKKSAQASKELEQEYQKAVKQHPVATRAGYLPTAAAEMFIPGTAGFKVAKGASALTKAAMGGGAAGLTAGAVSPTGQEDYGKRMEEKAKSAGLGAALGTTLGVAGPLAMKGGKAVGEFAGSFKKPLPIADVKDLAQIGEKGFQLVSDKAEKKYVTRKTEADKNYDIANNAARKAQAKGEPFAASAPGKTLIDDLEKQKNIIAGSEKFGVGEEKVKGIDRLINALKGETTGGVKTPIGKGVVSAGVTKTSPKSTKEKDISAVVEELRFLRDVDAKGKTYEAYAGLDAGYKRDLIKKLEEALYAWNPEYKTADTAYKAASEKLKPFKTELMSSALKGEKFNPKDLVASPEEFGPKFFSDVNSVKNLKDVTEDPVAVSKFGKEYVASLFANKEPKAVQDFVQNPQNIPWLKEAGIYDDVAKYAKQATTAKSRKDIAANLGKIALGTTIGVGAASGLGRALGF